MFLRHRRRLAALSVLPGLLSIAACGGGGSSGDSGGGGGGGGGPTVTFDFSGQNVQEGDLVLQVGVTLSDSISEDVTVHFSWTGSAQFLTDYFVPAGSPLVIPETTTKGNIQVTISEDTKGELDETVVLTMVGVDNAGVGATAQHTITIQDEDAIAFQETEPNSDIPDADEPGNAQKAVSYAITGAVLSAGGADDADVYHMSVTEDVSLDLTLTPVSQVSFMTLDLTDGAGTSFPGFPLAAQAPGEVLALTYPVSNGDELYLWVTTVGSTSYFLDAVGLEFP